MDAATSLRPDVCAADRARRKLRAEANRLCKREGRSAPALPVLFCADCEMFSAVPAFPRTLRDALPLSQRFPRKSRCSCVIDLPAHIARRAPAISTLSAQIEMFMRYRLPAHIAKRSHVIGSSRAHCETLPPCRLFPRKSRRSPTRSGLSPAASISGASKGKSTYFPRRPFGDDSRRPRRESKKTRRATFVPPAALANQPAQ